MESIPVEIVLNAAEQLLNNNQGHLKIFTRQNFIKVSESVFIDSEYIPALSNIGLDSIDKIFTFEAAKNLNKKNLASFRSRLEFAVNSPRKTTFYLKRYDNPPIGIQLKTWLAGRARKSLGFMEYETSQFLREAGINTPKTIAYGRQWGSLFEKRSFFITEKIPDAEALERKLPDCFEGKISPENIKLRRIFISGLANFIKKFHETNYRHRDLYMSHIFYNKHEGFYLIDLARAFRPLLLSRRFQIKDIAQLYYSAPGKYFSRTDRLRFFLKYTNHKKLNQDDIIFIRQVMKKVHQMAQHDKKHGRKAPFAK